MSDTARHTPLNVKSRIGVILLLLCAGAGIAFALVKLKPKPEKIERSSDGLLVEVRAAAPQSIAMTVEAFGTVEARHQVTEVAEVPGRVVLMSSCLKEGMFFKKGDELLRIDPRVYELAVERAAANLAASEAELARLGTEQTSNKKILALAADDSALAERERERQENLQKSGTVAEAAVEVSRRSALTARQQQQRIENTLEALKAQSAAAEAQKAMAAVALAEARLSLDKTRIAAPFDGRTMEKMVEEGQFVAAGQRLATIYDTSAVEVAVNLPFEDLQWLDLSAVTRPLISGVNDGSTTAGAMAMDAPPAALPRATAILETAARTYQWEGFVARVAGVVDRATRTVPVIVEFPNPWSSFESGSGSPPLVPGMFVKVTLEGRRYDGIFEIPRGALREGDQVFIAESDQLRIRHAAVLRTTGNIAWLSAGVAAGDMIILSPISTAVDGLKIRTRAAVAAPLPPYE